MFCSPSTISAPVAPPAPGLRRSHADVDGTSKDPGFVRWNLHCVLEAFPGLDQSVDYLILPAHRRNIGSVEMDVGDVCPHCAIAGGAGAGSVITGVVTGGERHLHAGHVVARAGARNSWEVVLEMNNELVAGIDAQRRCFQARIRHITISGKPLRVGYGKEFESDFQNAVLTLQLRRGGYNRPNRIARANLIGRIRT